jgi:L-ascorbate metabolism protein UlaG (beta-lactamase superfamily)
MAPALIRPPRSGAPATMLRRLAAAALALAAVAALAPFTAGPALSQDFSNCQAIARTLPGARVIPAGLSPTPANAEYEVEISYVGHATFRIVAPDGTTIATDFTGNAGEDVLPDVVTMNIAHTTHYTLFPDPRIPHVLQGWSDEPGEKAEHFLTVGDVLIRNVTTDIRSYGGVQADRNSIFIFEVAGLCLGHLGHLHQPLSDAQVAEIGRLDVVFVPIDGTYTMDQSTMMDVVSRLRASIAIPMHWFSRYSLESFVAQTREDGLAVRMSESPTMRVSLNTLPEEPTLMVLPREFGF